MATEAIAATDLLSDIALADLTPASWNARKTFDEAKLNELASSIQEHGVQMPLIVRPLRVRENGETEYEIVAGHRRFEVLKRVNYYSAPCIVRDLDDDMAREIGMVDNLQRENLPPIEEARGFEELMNAAGATVESVAAKVGKAASYVGRRLRLLDAILPVQEALTAGAIEIGHALELARLDSKQQQRLLHQLNCGFSVQSQDDEDDDFDESDFDDSDLADDEGDDGDDGGTENVTLATGTAPQSPTWRQTPMSVVELKREIGRTMLKVLADAPFALEDEIEPGACSECPKRTANASLLFPDVSQDVCTDRACFDGKVRTFVNYNLEHAKEQGRALIALGSEYYYDRTSSVVRGYDVVLIDEQRGECASQEEAIWIDGAKAGHRAMICRNRECKTHYGADSNNQGRNAKASPEQTAERKKTLAKVAVQKRYRKALLNALGEASVLSSTIDALSIDVAEYNIKRMTSVYNVKFAEALGWNPAALDYGHSEDLRKILAAITPAERLRAAHLAIHASELAVQEYAVNGRDYRPTGFETLAGYLDVDAAAMLTAEQEAQAAKSRPKTKTNVKPATDTEPAPESAPTPEPEPEPEPEAATAKPAQKPAKATTKPKAKTKAKPKAKPAKKAAAKKTNKRK